MNYQKIYNQLIEKAKSENRKKLKRDNPKYIYYENHHIIPKSMGGNNSKENLVLLTAKEHFVAHKLLIEFTEGANKRSMVFALHKMIFSRNDGGRKVSSREYSVFRKTHSKAVSENNKIRFISPETCEKIRQSKVGLDIYTDELREIRSQQTKGKGNPMYGVRRFKEDSPLFGYKHTEKSIKIMSETHKNREIVECPYCGKICDISNAKRWHFDNCKHNPNISEEAILKKEIIFEKLRASNIGRIISEKERKRRSESMKGDKNPFYGKKHTIESINKIKASKHKNN